MYLKILNQNNKIIEQNVFSFSLAYQILLPIFFVILISFLINKKDFHSRVKYKDYAFFAILNLSLFITILSSYLPVTLRFMPAFLLFFYFFCPDLYFTDVKKSRTNKGINLNLNIILPIASLNTILLYTSSLWQ